MKAHMLSAWSATVFLDLETRWRLAVNINTESSIPWIVPFPNEYEARSVP